MVKTVLKVDFDPALSGFAHWRGSMLFLAAAALHKVIGL